MSELNEKYRQLNQKIGSSAVLIAVSKGQTLDRIEELYHLGHRDFGENYVQELRDKAQTLAGRGCGDIRWHFIGHLQSNKAKLLVPYLASIHSVDSEKLALLLSKSWSEAQKKTPLPIFLEVNIDQESRKSGFKANEIVTVAKKIAQISELELQGLMCVPSSEQNPQPGFARLKELEIQCRPYTQGKLSMGMSNDFELAIQEGATHVRVGTALFGQRYRA